MLTFLAVAFAAKGHAAPIARAAGVAPSRSLGALDQIHAKVPRILHNGRIEGFPNKCVWSSIRNSHEAHQGDDGGSELHVA